MLLGDGWKGYFHQDIFGLLIQRHSLTFWLLLVLYYMDYLTDFFRLQQLVVYSQEEGITKDQSAGGMLSLNLYFARLFKRQILFVGC